MDKVDKVILPGATVCKVKDLIHQFKDERVIRIELGPGLRRVSSPKTGVDIVQATTCGVFRHQMKTKRSKSGAHRNKRSSAITVNLPVSNIAAFWIDCAAKRYEPRTGDRVVSIVLSKTHEHARLSLGNCDSYSTLPRLAFENATKRNRPELNAGDCLLARIVSARRDCEPELSCVTADGRANGLGVLHGAASQHGTSAAHVNTVVRFDVRCTRSLLAISKKHSRSEISGPGSMPFPFELTIGANGVVLVSARSMRELHTVVRSLRKTFEAAESKSDKPTVVAHGPAVSSTEANTEHENEPLNRVSVSARVRFAKILNEMAEVMWLDAK